ncbi:MAG TPA: amidohydrolase family protein [Stellaceae bacterium]|nr:amidohydrolase family protein [Stellaceae bacterium]
MIYRCSERPAGGGDRPRQPAFGAGLSVDMHCHVHVDAADAMVAPFREPGQEPILHFTNDATMAENRLSLRAAKPKLDSLEARLDDMDAAGIDLQVLSPSPFQYFYWAEPDLARRTSRLINEWIAEQAARRPDRFAGFATVPLQDTRLAIEELDHAITRLGLKGVEIGTLAGTDELSAERLAPFFARAEALGSLVFIHPNGFSHGARFAAHNLINLIGNPLETTLSASRLIFDGTLDRFPRVNFCLAHGGGYLPMYFGRMDHAHAARSDCRLCIDAAPSGYLRRFHFDTVVYTTAQLDFLAQTYGADRLVMGSDYPYDMCEPDPMSLVCSSTVLTDDEKALVIGGNALRLLGLSGEALAAMQAARDARLGRLVAEPGQAFAAGQH